MANVQKEKGYTTIANELLEVVVRTPLPGRHKDVWFFVARKTYGFHKKKDYISLTQFEMGTGIDRKSICRILKDLVVWKLLFKNKNIYGLNKDYSTWLVAPRPLGGSGREVTRVVAWKPHTKETNTKEINTRGEIVFNPKGKKTMAWKQQTDDVEEGVVQIDENYQEKKPEPKKHKRSPSEEVFELFGKNYPRVWLVNKNQRAAADRLLEEHGFEQIAKAVKFYNENKEDQFCPVIASPYALEQKWVNLHSFKTKNNL